MAQMDSIELIANQVGEPHDANELNHVNGMNQMNESHGAKEWIRSSARGESNGRPTWRKH